MNLVQQTSTVNTTALKNRAIKYIVIHYTAGVTSKSGTAKNTAKYFAKEAAKASADFIVDDEYVVQFNPDIKNRYCWHAGGSKYKTKGGSLYKIATSANSIGIEVCSTNDTGKVTQANDCHFSFTEKVINNAIELTKQLMKEYNIDIEHVIRHYDVNGKPCPGIIGWNADTNDETAWLKFKEALVPTQIINETKNKSETVQDKTAVEETKEPVKVETIENKEPVKQELDVKKEEKPIVVPKEVLQPLKPKVKEQKNKGLLETILDIIFGLFK